MFKVDRIEVEVDQSSACLETEANFECGIILWTFPLYQKVLYQVVSRELQDKNAVCVAGFTPFSHFLLNCLEFHNHI